MLAMNVTTTGLQPRRVADLVTIIPMTNNKLPASGKNRCKRLRSPERSVGGGQRRWATIDNSILGRASVGQLFLIDPHTLDTRTIGVRIEVQHPDSKHAPIQRA